MTPVAAILPQIARVASCVRGIAVLQVLPHVPAILADVPCVVADILAIAAQLAAGVAGFLLVPPHLVPIPWRIDPSSAQRDGQRGTTGDLTDPPFVPFD